MSVKRQMLAGVFLMIASGLQAATITWDDPVDIIANSDISTNGSLVYAKHFGTTASTVNGVEFTSYADGSDIAISDNGFNSGVVNATYTPAGFSVSAEYETILDVNWYKANTGNNGVLTLNGLSGEVNYEVQLWVLDHRFAENRTDAFTGLDGVINTAVDFNWGEHITGTFTTGVGESSQDLTFNLSRGNVNAVQVRRITPSKTFVHPGIGLSVEGLDAIKANLDVEPWKTGYEALLASSQSSLDYVMQGPANEVGRSTNAGIWGNDMTAVHNLARLWYFTEEDAYAQKARDILISWATTHTEFLTGETYLTMGYNAFRVFEGADILRGTWPGWTQSDTDICKAYFETVWWDEYHIAVPGPLRSANQGMAQFVSALGVAVFNDDEEKFEQCLKVFRADAAGALLSSLPNGQVGDTGRDAHDQGQLKLMAWSAEVFWNQGVDVHSEYDHRLLAAAEYISRFNVKVDTPFVQAGTVYDIYPARHTLAIPYGGRYKIEESMLNLLHSAYVTRMGMRAPYLEEYLPFAAQSADAFTYLLPSDNTTAEAPVPLAEPATVASVTSLNETNMGDCSGGSASYNAGTWTVSGRGSSLWYSSEPDYHFAYLPVTGDATITAQVTSFSGGGDLNARAGLVFTESLNSGDEMGAVVFTAPDDDDDLDTFYRGQTASSHQADSHGKPNQPQPRLPYWLKIERIGDRVNFFNSPDGASWSCAGSADYALGETAYFGLAVSADNNNNLATATFTKVRITGGDGGEAIEVPEAPVAIFASPGGDVVPLRWMESFEADSYKVWRSSASGGPYTLIAEETGTSYIDTNANFGTYFYAVSAVNTMGESPRSPEDQLHDVYTDWFEAEEYDAQSGVTVATGTRDFFGGRHITNLTDGDWARYDNIPIYSGAIFEVRAAGFGDDIGQIEVRLGSPTGTLIGAVTPFDTGRNIYWETTNTTLSVDSGIYDLYLVFTSVTPGSAAGINLNWFDITYPDLSLVNIGLDADVSFDPGASRLVNRGGIPAWDATSSHLNLLDGSDLSGVHFTALDITSWKTAAFSDVATETIWDVADLSGIVLEDPGDSFGAGDRFVGTDFSGATLKLSSEGGTHAAFHDAVLTRADFSNVVWAEPTASADAARFFSGGSGVTAASNKADAVNFSGADLSLITGDARTVMINNLGGFDGSTPIGAKVDAAFISKSGWSRSALMAAGWQVGTKLLVEVVGSDAGSLPAFSSSDLAQTQYLSSSASGGEAVSTRHAELFNGVIGDHNSGTGDSGVVRMTSDNTITVTFDTSVNTNGYDISGISTVFGWNPAGNGRSNQGYELILTFVDGSSATLVGPQHWAPNNPASYWTKVSFADEAGGVLNSSTMEFEGSSTDGTGVTASGVKAVTFDITEDANANGVVIAREFDVFGMPSVLIPEPDSPVMAVDENLTVISWATTYPHVYTVQSNLNLTTNAWETFTNVVGTPPETTVVLPVKTSDQLFFRIIVE